jgi:hypothetical protein
MEDCKICFTNKSDKKLPCFHLLCSNCVVRLNSACCPYCRQQFTFSNEEIKERIKLGIINGYKWDLPPGLAFRPQDWLENNRQLNRSLLVLDDDLFIYQQNNQAFQRARINMDRKRRRALSFDEVLERRRMIKEKIARHKERQNGRLKKLKWFEDDD